MIYTHVRERVHATLRDDVNRVSGEQICIDWKRYIHTHPLCGPNWLILIFRAVLFRRKSRAVRLVIVELTDYTCWAQFSVNKEGV